LVYINTFSEVCSYSFFVKNISRCVFETVVTEIH
jgi:hypothetical protein